MICLHFKIPDNFIHPLLRKGFWVVHIPFDKFHFLSEFLVDHLLHPVGFTLCLFALLTYYVRNRFFPMTIWLPLTILLCIIYFHFYLIGLYGVVLCYYLREFIFSQGLPLNSYFKVFASLSFEVPIQWSPSHLFFLVLVAVFVLILLLATGINFVLFNIFLESLYCIQVIFSVGESSSSFFSCHKESVDVISRM